MLLGFCMGRSVNIAFFIGSQPRSCPYDRYHYAVSRFSSSIVETIGVATTYVKTQLHLGFCVSRRGDLAFSIGSQPKFTKQTAF